jgi:hypothetical protein
MSTRIFKKILIGALALLGLLAGEVFAQATNANIAVSAVVPKACRFYTSPAAMVIEHSGGLIDPVSVANATGTSTLDYKCTNTVSPEFDIDTSATFASPKTRTVNLLGAVTAANLPADITVTATGGAGTGLGAGQEKTATISGLITPANFGAAAPDSYSKTVRIDIRAIP